MKNRRTKTIITTVILIMALVQFPLFYYFISGFAGMLIEVPYMLIGLGLTITLLNSLIKFKNTNSRYHIIGLIVTILIAFPASSIQSNVMEHLDWKLQLTKRTAIVEQVKAGLLKPDEQGWCMLKDNSFLPVSNGGNKIFISHDKNGFLEIEFYIDPGFLDHYSALVYTDRKLDMSQKDSDVIRHLDAHWYTLHF